MKAEMLNGSTLIRGEPLAGVQVLHIYKLQSH